MTKSKIPLKAGKLFILAILLLISFPSYAQTQKTNPDSIPFAPAVNYGAGSYPYSVFCADLDGDNDLDLAVANYLSNNVSILKNNGDGTFQGAANYWAGSGPWSVFCADLDGDGDLDLAVANANSNNVSILKNNGNGTFQSAVNYGAGASPRSVFCADLDGDGDLDLAVANAGGSSNNVSILKNNGDGTFQGAVNYATGGGGPWSVFCADLDGDNDLDLAVANYGSNNVSILKNNGDGTFQGAVNYWAGSGPWSVFCADLDGDNDLDLAVPNYGNDNVSILKNNGDGTFQSEAIFGTGDGPSSVFCADLDGDNDLDLAVANISSNNVSILKNNGDGTFQGAANYGVGVNPNSVFCADLDGDNDLDLAVANYYSANVSILKNLSDQPVLGTIAGRIKDANTQQNLEGVLVEALQAGIVKGSDNTNNSGQYNIANLSSGTYDVRASKTGYETQTQTGKHVFAGQTTTVNFQMAPLSGDLSIINVTPIQVVWNPSYFVVNKGTALKVTVQSSFSSSVKTSFRITYGFDQHEYIENGPNGEGVELTAGENWLYIPGGPASTEAQPWSEGGGLIWENSGVETALSVEVDPFNQITESNEDNNTYVCTSIPFYETNGLKVGYYKVKSVWPADYGTPSWSSYRETLEESSGFMRTVWPFATSGSGGLTATDKGEYVGDIEPSIGWKLDLLQLQEYGWLDNVDRAVGIVTPAYFGYHSLGGTLGICLDWFTSSLAAVDRWTAAPHDIHHNFPADDDWPPEGEEYDLSYPDPGLDANGFWIRLPPIQNKEISNGYCFMGKATDIRSYEYEGSIPVLVCNRCYEHLLGAMREGTPLLQEDQKTIFIAALVDENDTVSLKNMYVLEGRPAEYPSSLEGDYSIEMKDSNEQVIMEVRFDLRFRMRSDTGWVEQDVDGFAFSIPYSQQTARIQIKHNSNVLAERVVSANTPTVHVVYPNGGEQLVAESTYTITWSGDDLDGGALNYCVQFTDDGGTNWKTLTIDLAETSFAWKTSNLDPGNSYKIRVIASDGINTSEDESDSLFEITESPYVRGDANGDGVINVTDVVYLINYLFLVPPGPAPQPWAAGDANCDGVVNVSDVVYLINYLFLVPPGPPPGC